MKNIVVYGIVIDTDDSGIFLDFPYLGGETENHKEAEGLARDITDDKDIPGTAVITKIYQIEDSLTEIKKLAHRQFSQIASDMYDVEDIQRRREKARKKRSYGSGAKSHSMGH